MSAETINKPPIDPPIIQGSLWKAIWQMTWPLMVNMFALAIGNFVDTWIAGKLGTNAQAAIGISGQIWYFIMMLAMALEVGAIALVSRYYGARDINNAAEAARQALIFGGAFGILSTCIGLTSCRALLHLLGASASVEQQGWDYLKFSIVSTIPWTLLWASQAIFRAIGDTRTAMLTILATIMLTIVLDFMLCLSPLHMGMGGLGLAWLIAASIGFSRNVIQLRKSELAQCLQIFDSLRNGISKAWFLRFINIGLPGCLQEIAMIGGNLGVFWILSHTDDSITSQAAWAVGWRLEEIAVLAPMFALNMSITTIVGQNLGARQPDRAEKAGWNMVMIGIIANIAVAFCLWLFAPFIANLMSSDSSVINVIIDYIHLVVWAEPFFATWFILTGAMQGAGYTRVPMIISVVCFDLIRLSIAWYLAVVTGMGANGTWLAMALSSVFAGLLMALTFKWGQWKHHVV